jgi:hypothetical protein
MAGAGGQTFRGLHEWFAVRHMLQSLLTGTSPRNSLTLTANLRRLTVWNRVLNRLKKFLAGARKWNAHAEFPSRGAIYTSVPVWKPWRDF